MINILVVDDEQKIRMQYARMFATAERGDFRVLEAADAWEAAEIMMQHQVDVVLLDLQIPEINGQELFKVIRECNTRTQVIISSVYPVEDQQKMVPQAGGYFDKSQGPRMLLEKVLQTVEGNLTQPVERSTQ